MLADRVVAYIRDNPGINVNALLHRFTREKRQAVRDLLRRLRKEGVIEMFAHGRYRLPLERQQVDTPTYSSSGFIEPPPLARLMAGR